MVPHFFHQLQMNEISPQQLAAIIELYYKNKCKKESIAVLLGLPVWQINSVLLNEFEGIQQAEELSNISVSAWPGTY